MANLRGAAEVLVFLTERLPPPEGKRHALMLVEGGLKIIVTLAGDRWQSIELEDADLDKGPDQVVDETLSLLASMQATGG